MTSLRSTHLRQLNALCRSPVVLTAARPVLPYASRRGVHLSSARLADKPLSDASVGVDPGYTAPKDTTHSEQNAEHMSDQARPSHLSDPFPLPFDPRLQGMSLASSHQNDQLKGAPSWEGGPPDIITAEAGEGYETPVPIRVPGRGPNDEDRTTRIARLVYQARKRGTLETDLLLSTFAKTYLKELPDKELLEFDLLLDEPDWDIYYWLTERKPVPERWRASFETEGRLGFRLRKHTKNEEGVLRTMPALSS